MNHSQWESAYEQAYERGLKKIRNLSGVCCAFHSVIDGAIRLTPEIIAPVLDSSPSLQAAALRGVSDDPPAEIHTPEDFVQGMFHSVSRGAALQRMIRSESVFHWAMETFGSGDLRLGGTSANMARSLAPLGIPVTVYANPLTKELGNLFGDSPHIHVIHSQGSGYERAHPREAAQDSGVFAIHWIFEYGTDFRLDLDGTVIQPHRANRYIPSWNPRNNQFHMDPVFSDGFMELHDEYSHLLFSGFHILSETYPDGQTCEDVVAPLGTFVEMVNRDAPAIRIHLELASIGSKRIRQAVLSDVVPHVHSIGLNETELPLIIENVDSLDRANSLRSEGSASGFLSAALDVMKASGIPRVHFHNLGYYLCIERGYGADPVETRSALLFAAVMAAARAKNGLFSCLEDIEAGRTEPIADLGQKALEDVARHIQQPGFVDSGIAEVDGFTVVGIPTRFVQNPLFTVGLGDTISAGAFLTE